MSPGNDSTVKQLDDDTWHGLRSGERFGVLLLLVFTTFVFISAAPDKEWTALVAVLLQGGTLLLAMRFSRSRPRYIRIAEIGVAIAVVVTVAALVSESSTGRAIVRTVSAIIVAFTPAVIARSIYHSLVTDRRVTLQSIFGVVSIYLLAGMLFAFAYSVAGEVDDRTFFTVPGDYNLQDYLYFSFVTLTTVGYGDLVAAHQLGRTMAVVEALFGQIYLIAVLSLFVGNLRPGARVERAQEERS